MLLKINISKQSLRCYRNHQQLIKEYVVSTAKNGVGETYGSEKTPRGWHYIRAKIGNDVAYNTVFQRRRPTGEIYQPSMSQQFPERDWILTRILWLCGLEVGKNRLRNVDTMRRKIYIHGVPDERCLGKPASHGCIQMYNADIIELFDLVTVGSKVLIEE
jgi:L,D-transpeptidase YbiS